MLQRSLALIIGIALLLAAAPPVSAATPTKGVDHYNPGAHEKFDWGTGATGPSRAWLRDAFQNEAEVKWPDNNNSLAPTFTYDGSIQKNWVRFQKRSDSNCTSGIAWYACTLYDGSAHWGEIIYADESGVTWCQETGTNSGCLDVQRVAVHELGHVAGLARSADNGGNDAHSHESQANSMMQLNTPKYDAGGWNHHRVRACDLIELQREYDVASYTGSYGDCVDELNNGTTGGLLTSVASQGAPSTTCARPNAVVYLGGSLHLGTGSALGLISGNPLGSRTITLQRRPSGGSWSTYATLITTSTTASWSRAVNINTGVYDFRIHYDGETPIHADNSNVVTVMWDVVC